MPGDRHGSKSYRLHLACLGEKLPPAPHRLLERTRATVSSVERGCQPRTSPSPEKRLLEQLPCWPRTHPVTPSASCPATTAQGAKCRSKDRPAVGTGGILNGAPQLPSNHHCPRSSRLPHLSPGDTGAGREQWNSPLIQTHLPLFPPSTASPPLPSPLSSPSSLDLIPPNSSHNPNSCWHRGRTV